MIRVSHRTPELDVWPGLSWEQGGKLRRAGRRDPVAQVHRRVRLHESSPQESGERRPARFHAASGHHEQSFQSFGQWAEAPDSHILAA